MSSPTILAFDMPDYARVSREQRASNVSSFSSFVRWLQLKKYQYEVTFSLYMLTPAEKLVFNLVLFILVSLLVAAAFLYLPSHVVIIYNRIWYYIHGDFANKTTTMTTIGGAGAGAGPGQFAIDGLRMTSQALESMSPTAIVSTVRATLAEL